MSIVYSDHLESTALSGYDEQWDDHTVRIAHIMILAALLPWYRATTSVNRACCVI